MISFYNVFCNDQEFQKRKASHFMSQGSKVDLTPFLRKMIMRMSYNGRLKYDM